MGKTRKTSRADGPGGAQNRINKEKKWRDFKVKIKMIQVCHNGIKSAISDDSEVTTQAKRERNDPKNRK
jgi:hypothetical protein